MEDSRTPSIQAETPRSALGGRGADRWIKLASAAAILLEALVIPPPPGLSLEGQRVLGIVIAAVVLWATEAIPVALASLLVVVLLTAAGGVKGAAEALVGFSSPILYFLIGSQAMGAAVMRSGLADRLARHLVDRSGGSPTRLTVQLLLALPFMAFLIPSAINRNNMLIPAYEQAFRALAVGKGDRLARVIMLTLGMLNPLASSAFMTGGLAPMTTSTLLGGFTWLRWFALMAVPYYLLMALGGVLIYLLYRPTDAPSAGPVAGSQEWGSGDEEPLGGRQSSEGAARRSEPRSGLHGRASSRLAERESAPAAAPDRVWGTPRARVSHSGLSREERVTLLVIAAASLLWLTDFVHHWNPAIPALMAAVVLMWPRVGIFTWGQFERTIGWSNFFFLGASLSLTQALISSGAASWFAQGLLGLLASGSSSAVLLALFVILVAAVVHLGIPNQSACIALLIPLVTAFASATGINPVAAGLIVGIVVDTVILYQVQTVTMLLAYETGHFAVRDVARVGLGMLLLTVLVVLLVAIPWWGVLGLPFAP